MNLDREAFLRDGYRIVRQVIPSDRLDATRASYEILVERQKAIWARNRKPNDPPGGVWEISAQPRLMLDTALAEEIDARTAAAIEVWLLPNAHGVSSQLLDVPDASVTQMLLMCNPVSDRGPANWHRDLHPIDTAPLQGYIEDIAENGPSYVQWNIPLYDDSVLWVVPGSHIRLNTEEENRLLLENPRRALPRSIPVELKAGDGVVYILPILHWASHYGTKMRRTIHGGFAPFSRFEKLHYVRHLSASAQAAFERWSRRNNEAQDITESILRAAIREDGRAFEAGLERLRPGLGRKGKDLRTVFLCKAAYFIFLNKHPETENVPVRIRNASRAQHPITLNWGPAFSERFTVQEAEALWERFSPLEARLQSDREHFEPGFQAEPMRHYFSRMPHEVSMEAFLSTW
ncbi:MAG: phytanoyl-CoA dioxygenase family protein [Planctomycetes bacterium]|nr:phytanoyl-CoA dioxygenase family protein [Planctomycetota bacterium]